MPPLRLVDSVGSHPAPDALPVMTDAVGTYLARARHVAASPTQDYFSLGPCYAAGMFGRCFCEAFEMTYLSVRFVAVRPRGNRPYERAATTLQRFHLAERL